MCTWPHVCPPTYPTPRNGADLRRSGANTANRIRPLFSELLAAQPPIAEEHDERAVGEEAQRQRHATRCSHEVPEALVGACLPHAHGSVARRGGGGIVARSVDGGVSSAIVRSFVASVEPGEEIVSVEA